MSDDLYARAELKASIARSGRSLSLANNNLPSVFYAAVDSPSTDVMRGYADRRSLGLRILKPETVKQIAPRGENALASWLSFMDAFGEATVDTTGYDGLRANARAAREDILGKNHYEENYDSAAAVLAWDFMRGAMPDFDSKFPDIAARLDAEKTEYAEKHSVHHLIIAERLKKDSDILAAVMGDPDAFAFRVKRLIEDKPEEQEMMSAPFLTLILPKDMIAKGYNDPKVVFERREKLKEMRQRLEELEENRRKDILKRADENQNARISRNKKRRIAAREIKHEIKELKQQLSCLNYELKKLDCLVKDALPDDIEYVDDTKSPTTSVDDYYKVLPSAKDKVSKGGELITQEKAEEVLDGLNELYAKELRQANAVGRKLHGHLMTSRGIQIESDLEEGILDPQSLSKLVIDPFYPNPYMLRHEHAARQLDACATIVIDNSASMKGQDRISLAFVAADRFSYWLSGAGIPTEVLGFTTVPSGVDYGGRLSSTSYRTQGLHHIVYKRREQRHTQAVTRSMAAMLSEEVRHGTVLGESVAWAHNEILAAPQQRKILMVLTDGEVGGIGLEKDAMAIHLRDTVMWIEEKSPVEIIGIGIGAKLDRFFTNTVTIHSPYELMETMTSEFKKILDTPLESRHRLSKATRHIKAPKRDEGPLIG